MRTSLFLLFLQNVCLLAPKEQFLVMASKPLISLDYEVYGRVQGVFFRKYTEKKGKELRLTGWVMNTSYGSVKGQLEGPKDKVAEMKHWLQKVGSPSSRIERCEFKNEREISRTSFEDFSVRY